MDGRASVDIIRSNLWKVSAVAVESALLALKDMDIFDCCVVGVPDEEQGQRIAALVCIPPRKMAMAIVKGDEDGKFRGKEMVITSLREQLAEAGLPDYMLPTMLRVISSDVPRNSRGKVSKKEIASEYFGEGSRGWEVWDDQSNKSGPIGGKRRLWQFSGIGNAVL